MIKQLKITNDVLDNIFASFHAVQDSVHDIIDLPEYFRGEKELELSQDRTEVLFVREVQLPQDLEVKVQIIQDKRDLLLHSLELCQDNLLAWTCSIRDLADKIDPEHQITF